MSDRVQSLVAAFRGRFGSSPAWIAEAPGRVNLIGEHTDYNGGFVLPAALDRTTLVAAAPAVGPLSRLWSVNLGEENAFDASRPERTADMPWSNYVRGVAWALLQAGYSLPQVDLAVQSEVPMGAGLSSSAALEVASAAALAASAVAGLPAVELALVAHRAETDFVGVPCGIMDQFVSCLAVEDHALLIDCRAREATPVSLGLEQLGVALVVVDAAASRELAGSAYRERREQCGDAVRLLRQLLGHPILDLRDVTMADLETAQSSLPPIVYRRARHVVSENARVARLVQALQEQRLDEVGEALRGSHCSLRDDYEVSSPELDLLVELAWNTPGVIGARLTGAGFGGCTVNLVRAEAVDRFEREVVGEYRRRIGKPARSHLCRVVGGVRLVTP